VFIDTTKFFIEKIKTEFPEELEETPAPKNER